MNPLKMFLTNLQNNPAKTVTGIFTGAALILSYFGVVIPADWQNTAVMIAGLVATGIVLFQPQKK